MFTSVNGCNGFKFTLVRVFSPIWVTSVLPQSNPGHLIFFAITLFPYCISIVDLFLGEISCPAAGWRIPDQLQDRVCDPQVNRVKIPDQKEKGNRTLQEIAKYHYTLPYNSTSQINKTGIFPHLFWKNTNMKILLDKIISDRNLSIRQVSILTGIPRSTLSDIISGRTSPRLDTLEQLARKLKVRISDLYDSPYK